VTATHTRRLRPSVTDAAFHRFVGEVQGDVRETIEHLARGRIRVEEWADIMLDTLAEAHAQAGYLGRQRAGDRAPFDQDDTRFGQLVAQEEWPYLSGFAHDIATGRYTGEDGLLEMADVQRRANLYVARTYGTANEALALTAGGDEVWHWKRGKHDSCSACVRLEENSPYQGPPPTLPRMNQTPCLQNCGCVAYTASGLHGFAP
jgi:hypothetical protein